MSINFDHPVFIQDNTPVTILDMDFRTNFSYRIGGYIGEGVDITYWNQLGEESTGDTDKQLKNKTYNWNVPFTKLFTLSIIKEEINAELAKIILDDPNLINEVYNMFKNMEVVLPNSGYTVKISDISGQLMIKDVTKVS